MTDLFLATQGHLPLETHNLDFNQEASITVKLSSNLGLLRFLILLQDAKAQQQAEKEEKCLLQARILRRERVLPKLSQMH